MEYYEINPTPTTNVFDKWEGSKRTELKKFDRTIHYKGFDIKRNTNVPVGAVGYWEIPELRYIEIGGIKKGFLTVSITQAKEVIDRYIHLNTK